MPRLDPVTSALPAGLEALRAAASAEGYPMLDVLVAEWASGANRFEREGEYCWPPIAESNWPGSAG